MMYKLTIELSSPIMVTELLSEDAIGEKIEPVTEIEITNTDSDITLIVGGIVVVNLTTREAVLLSSLLTERAYKQI